MNEFIGTIIKESLEDKKVLKECNILSTKISAVTLKHKTPWVKQWTLYNISISESKAKSIAKKLSLALDSNHPWYADFKNNTHHYIIFRNKIFLINRTNIKQYEKARQYGLKLCIPEYQVNFCANLLPQNNIQ